jgi:hypothetical protein
MAAIQKMTHKSPCDYSCYRIISGWPKQGPGYDGGLVIPRECGPTLGLGAVLDGTVRGDGNMFGRVPC